MSNTCGVPVEVETTVNVGGRQIPVIASAMYYAGLGAITVSGESRAVECPGEDEGVEDLIIVSREIGPDCGKRIDIEDELAAEELDRIVHRLIQEGGP